MTVPAPARRILALLVLAAAPAAATSIVPISDRGLVDRAPLVVVGTFEHRLPNTSGLARTEWSVRVERVLKGRLDSSHLVLRTLGGTDAAGRRMRIAGAPEFVAGGRAVLFLGRDREGVRRLVDVTQGAFLIARGRYASYAYRDLSEVRIAGGGSHRERLRDARRFADWIEDRAGGRSRATDYLVRPRRADLERLEATAPAFHLLLFDGRPGRWFEFDGGGAVTFKSHESGFPGVGGGGVAQVQSALAVWSAEPSTPIQLGYGGTSAATGGLESFDEENVVLWGDPNDEMPGPFNCRYGGTVAIGSYWAYPDRPQTFGGRSYLRILAGDVVFNDGTECIRNSRYLESVVAHEIGHTLGLHHSTENPYDRDSDRRNALMSWFRNPNLGARLGADDIAGAQALYLGSGPWATGPSDSCPGDQLCLLNGRFAVSADWENQFDGSEGWARPVRYTDISGFFSFNDPSNLELAVKIGDFGDRIKVFYTQLTNLRFRLHVTDTLTGRVKTYTNTPGDCGDLDDDFLAGASATAALADAEAPASIVNGRCRADATTLCLLSGRFAIAVDWRNQFNGQTGVGVPRALSPLTGAFSFGDPNNLELLIKTLDFGDHRLVLYGALSNLEYTIRVTDAFTGQTKTYFNPAGKYCGGLDESF